MASKSVESGSVSTRNKTNIWLVGQMTPNLSVTKLPSIKETLQLFFFYKNENGKSTRDCATLTACDVLSIWERAGVPTRLKKHVIAKVEQYFKEWQNLKKSKVKRSQAIRQKEKQWQRKLGGLFDIAHADALNIMKVEEDKQFLLAQREEGRRGLIGSVDKASLIKEAKLQKKREWLEKIREREAERINSLKTDLLSSSTATSTDSDTSISSEIVVAGPSTAKPPERKRGRVKLVDSHLASSLDAAKLSDRKAAIVITSTLKSAGSDPMEFNVNRSSIRRQRQKHRKEMAESLKREFKTNLPLTVHWDGKLLEDITGHETVDRLPILVSGQGIDQLLSVPKLDRGTGEACASAVYGTILEWGLSDKVKCMCFDTTAVNSGLRNGACILLEQKMEKDMLWLACRHHILEIMLEAVVSTALGPSSGPDILIFKRFKNYWSKIDQSDYKTVTSDPISLESIQNVAQDMISFAQNQLNQYQPRDDYKELLNLTIIYLGGVSENQALFRMPAGLHRARWMAKAMYCLKIFLFRHQFKITKKEEKGIKDVCIFSVMIYIKYWYQACVASSAPRNDLQLLKDLIKFENINPALSKVALKKVMGHLWYLSEELVSFAFFDDEIALDTKQKMVHALDNEGLEFSPKRISLVTKDIEGKNIEDFVSSNSFRFFEILGISSNFLKKDVAEWPADKEYKAGRDIVRSMRVVNDIAERGVALMEEYNKLITINEQQKQYLLLIVKEFRKKYPDSKKSTLVK